MSNSAIIHNYAYICMGISVVFLILCMVYLIYKNIKHKILQIVYNYVDF